MAPRHRARRGPSPALAALVVLAVVVLGWIAVRELGGEEPAAADPSGSPSPTETATTSAPPSDSPTEEPSGSPTETPDPSPELPALEAAAPARLSAEGLFDVGFDAATPGTDGVLEALSTDEVTRLEDRARPGQPTEDAVVVLGEDRYDSPDGAFNRLPDLEAGDEVVLTTEAGGRLVYTVEDSLTVAAAEVASTPAVRDLVPGRLVLVGLRYDENGSRGAEDLVVVARLTAVQS